jgi:hypothetical protein
MLELPDYRARRERGEVVSKARVEGVNGLDEREGGHLGKILARLAAVGKSTGDLLCEAEVFPDESLSRIAAKVCWLFAAGDVSGTAS